MNIVRPVAYVEGMDAHKLSLSVKREMEVELSSATWSCNDITFIYRITPLMCVDCLNFQQHKYDNDFKDIKLTHTGKEIVVVDYIKDKILNIYAVESGVIRNLIDTAFILEGD